MAKAATKIKPRESIAAPFSGPDWPATRGTTMIKVSDITAHPENPRTHPAVQVESLGKAMFDEFGVVMPPVVDENNRLIAGEGRWLSAKKRGVDALPCIVVKGWSESKKRRFMVADNRLPMLAGFDDAGYRAVLEMIKTEGLPIENLGFDAASLDALLIDEVTPEKGNLLKLINITIAEPKHVVANGDIYTLASKHYLFCESVISGWPHWAPLLKDNALFCPYPGVFVPFGEKAKDHPLIMVQPDGYISGHILDRWAEVHGKKSIKKIGSKK